MAYVMSNLAAAQGHEQARRNRDIVSEELSRDQITEGQRMASEWRVGTPLPTFNDFSIWP
jgi:predicted secreted hydrolase